MGLKVVVTGGSSGIGQATALTFVKNGHDVYATGRSESKLAETARQAKEAGGGKIYTGTGDVGVEADVNKNYTEAVKALGGDPDVLVLNAGYGFPSPLEETTSKDYDDTFNAVVRGTFLWLKAALPAFKKRGFGQIVIINSVVGDAPLGPGLAIYTASKFALTGLAKALRLELQGTGIKLASVHPGVVDTPAFVDWEKKGIPAREMFGLDKALSPYDIADAVIMIANQSKRSDIEKFTVWQIQ